MGDLLREEVAAKTDLGKELDGLMREGKIVPLETTLRLLRVALLRSFQEHPLLRGFLIDGFPRQMDQALAFEKSIGACGSVLFFDASEEVMQERLLKRGETSGRADDNLVTIQKRFKTFREQSMPVVEHYGQQNKLVKVRKNDVRTTVLSCRFRQKRPSTRYMRQLVSTLCLSR